MPFSDQQLLKLRLLAEGLSATPTAERSWREQFEGPLTLAEYATTSGVTVVLPGGLYVNAPLATAADGPVLDADGEGFVVRWGSGDVPVGVVPVPSFQSRRQIDVFSGEKLPYTAYGVTHTDRVRVSPIGGCAWRCKFCDLPYEWGYQKKHEDNLLAVIDAARDDPQTPARHVLISGGTPRAPIPTRNGRPGSDDEAWLDHVFEEVARRSPLPVDVMTPPRHDPSHPEKLRGMGVNMVSINLEISDPQRARQLAPAKAKVGREYTLDYIERAVEAFGVGFVQSLVVFGVAIEPIESTLRGIRDLVQRGCIPVLSGFRPHAATPMRDAPAASYEEMVMVLARALEICHAADTGVLPGPRCIPCHHNTVTIHDGSDFYCDLEDDITARTCQVS
jgi:uncharacterized radical SAM superfamily protein